MRRNRDDRKVRGEQVRSSREDKRTRTGVDEEPTGRTAGSQTVESDGAETISERTDAFAPDSFVETQAVEGVRERVERWLRADRPVHLIGPTGCGKTALSMRVAQKRDRPTVFVNGDATMTTADLVGEYAETERESVRDRYIHNVLKSKDIVRDRWVDNPLTVAVREGATLVYNEFSRTKPTANNVLLSMFEEGVLELPERRGEARYVDVHPEFRAVLTSNSVEYAGVHTPQDALLDRLVGIHMDFYDRETERAILQTRVDGIDEPLADHIVDLVRALRDADDVDITVGTRAMIMAAEGLAAATTEPDEQLLIDTCVDALSSKVPDRADVQRLQAAVAAASNEVV